jgi:hypothetical protein
MRNDAHGRESLVYALTPAAYSVAASPLT